MLFDTLLKLIDGLLEFGWLVVWVLFLTHCCLHVRGCYQRLSYANQVAILKGFNHNWLFHLREKCCRVPLALQGVF